MTYSPQAGETGTPLPDEEVVLRLCKASKDGRALETHFSLTDKDKEHPLCSLSVWVESLTSPSQAREFMGTNKLAYEIYCRLSVVKVRVLTTPGLEKPVLDVVWDMLYNDEGTARDPRPGAAGHSGITGLLKPPGMEKQIYKTLRTRLADLANEDLNIFS